MKEAPPPATPTVTASISAVAAAEIRSRDVISIFGRSPAAGLLPRTPSWSPDGRFIAYLRDSYDKEGRTHIEVWMYDTLKKVENPVFTESSGRATTYTWCGAERLVVASDGDLFEVSTDAAVVRLTHTKVQEKFPTASPNGARIAFVRDGDLFALDLLSKKEFRITEGASAHRRFGEVTWLYAEEFDTKTGMGWSNDGLKLWFLDTDVTNVPFRDILKLGGNTETMPYPRAGETNPLVRVAVADFSGAAPTVRYLDTGSDPDHYLPRVGWHPNNQRLLVTRLDRLQTELEYLLCPIDGSPCGRPWTERDPRFINLQPDPLILPGGAEMLFLSEQSGFAHIYQIGLDGKGLRPVTQGKWTVTEINAVDEISGSVMFTANVENPLEYKLYRIPLKGGEIERPASEQGCHTAIYTQDNKQYLDIHSALNRAPKADIRKADGELIGTLAAQDAGRYNTEGVVNDLFPISTPNGPMNALLTRPTVLQTGRKYPVLVLVYGGPHVQLAKNWFHTTYQPLRDLLARRDILVFTVDGRGSAGRGHDFDAAIRLSLGRLELEDQTAGVQYLKSLPFVDTKRIGVFGWSFGGTMALSGLLRSNEYCMGIAVAPVTDWRWYDSAYTERYMQRPVDNPEGYDNAALIPQAFKLKAPLLLVHGIADDNVHFVHSARMFEALIRANKRFESIFFPGKDHKIAGPAARIHLFTEVLRFIEEHL